MVAGAVQPVPAQISYIQSLQHKRRFAPLSPACPMPSMRALLAAALVAACSQAARAAGSDGLDDFEDFDEMDFARSGNPEAPRARGRRLARARTAPPPRKSSLAIQRARGARPCPPRSERRRLTDLPPSRLRSRARDRSQGLHFPGGARSDRRLQAAQRGDARRRCAWPPPGGGGGLAPRGAPAGTPRASPPPPAC